MATLKDLAKRMQKLAELVQVGTVVSESSSIKIALPSTVTKKVVKIILKTAIDLTPVDTGKAVSNWQIVFSENGATEIEPYFKGNNGSTRAECAKAAYQAGVAAISRWDGRSAIHIMNPVDYLTYLNYGTNKIVGMFIVERAVAAGRAYLREKS